MHKKDDVGGIIANLIRQHFAQSVVGCVRESDLQAANDPGRKPSPKAQALDKNLRELAHQLARLKQNLTQNP